MKKSISPAFRATNDKNKKTGKSAVKPIRRKNQKIGRCKIMEQILIYPLDLRTFEKKLPVKPKNRESWEKLRAKKPLAKYFNYQAELPIFQGRQWQFVPLNNSY